ncbi:toprim domain-containing protein [Sphingobium sp. 3R8]|uniref:toprim domain-containing protein n=1 Tax=Sphingobium sp. 3R8 TaxID=2874921 RepID=UPI001CCBA4C2|nr:toprim domain-containing protein [Sphingobium sp. 3R8]MBZ9649399.1 toprim domain-containing protein [Sphingobium sp. 3R8]
MEMEGVKPTEPIAQRLASGELIRFHCDGDGKGRQNGWATLYLDDRPAGAFGNYRLGISRKWRIDRDLSLTPEEKRQLQVEWAAAKLRRQEERERSESEAAQDARELWRRAGPVGLDHVYLLKKRLDPFLFRQDAGKLLVPMYDGAGSLWNLQRISGDGTKRFLRGGKTDGLFFLMGELSRQGETVGIGEGVATMAAVCRATGYPCIAAFSAKNIAAVARLWNNARPDLNYIICGDDDSHLPTNIDKEAAEAAALEIGAKVAFPLRRAA